MLSVKKPALILEIHFTGNYEQWNSRSVCWLASLQRIDTNHCSHPTVVCSLLTADMQSLLSALRLLHVPR
jgi:hypothetical protein